MLAMPADSRLSALDLQQALSKANRILEMVEVLILTANAAPDPRSKAHKLSLIRRHLTDLHELLEENPVLRQDEERYEALASALKVLPAFSVAAHSTD